MTNHLVILKSIVKNGIITEGSLADCHFKSCLTYSRQSAEDWPSFIGSVLDGVDSEYDEDDITMYPAEERETIEILKQIDPSITLLDLEFDT